MNIADTIIAEGERILFAEDRSSRRPEPEWVTKTIGASSITKLKAEDIADYIITQRSEQQRREDGLWSFLGNTLADAVFREQTPHREVQARFPIGIGDWHLQGHLDGLRIFVGWLPTTTAQYVVLEGKARGFCEEEEDFEAAAQASLNLALVEAMQKAAGQRIILPVATWQNDATALPAVIERDYEPYGIGLFTFPRDGPSSITETARPIKVREVSAAERMKVLDFYMRKARAIVTSIEAGNIDAARAWDASPEGILERQFAVQHHEIALKGDFVEAVLKTEEAKAERKKWQTHVDHHEAIACALLHTQGSKANPPTRSVTIPNIGRATLMGGANGTKSYLRFTPAKETKA